MKIAMVAVVLVFAFLMFGAVSNSTPEGQAKTKARSAIELCWDDYEKKSLDPGTKRFVASTCEMMEAKFIKEYGHKP